MRYVVPKNPTESHPLFSKFFLLGAVVCVFVISSCRPAIDDNSPDAAASSTPGSITTEDLKDGSVTPAKLSKAYLPLSGGTLTGSLTLAGTPTDSNHAATKSYVDTQIAGVSSSGGSVSTTAYTQDTASASNWSSTTTSPAQTAVSTAFEVILPSGVILPYGGAAAPTGYLLCNGAAVSRTTYARLFTAIGTSFGVGDGATTFNVPDMRGMFPRGTGTNGTATLANGGAVAGPSLGAQQNDQFQSHLHTMNNQPRNPNSAPAGVDANGYGASTDSTTAPIVDGANGTPRTGTETRPFNVGVNYIIKY